jgi:hypothetical protein
MDAACQVVARIESACRRSGTIFQPVCRRCAKRREEQSIRIGCIDRAAAFRERHRCWEIHDHEHHGGGDPRRQSTDRHDHRGIQRCGPGLSSDLGTPTNLACGGAQSPTPNASGPRNIEPGEQGTTGVSARTGAIAAVADARIALDLRGPSINKQLDTGDEARIVGREEHGGRGDLVRFPHAPHRN